MTVTGVVLDQKGKAVPGAEISLDNRTTTTNASGQFAFADLSHSNVLLKVTREGYYNELIPVYLFHSEDVATTKIDPILLKTKAANEVRFLFGGDTSFGRRYIDPKELTPRNEMPKDDPDALILVSQPLPGSQYVGQFIRPYYQAADWGVLNLETPLTNNPSTPHEAKAFAYFSFPESANALHWLGINYVSLGNNHLYDYLDIGVSDTINALNSINMPHSGAGLNSEEAFLPYRTKINDTPYSFLSMTSVSGSQHQVNYVAEENKAGAADLRDKTRVNNAIKKELHDSYIPILQLHGGNEYTYEPTNTFQKRINHAVKSGAKLVVGHHPHVAQGIGVIDGIVTIHSLGNLIFDQARLETMLGLLARVDMEGETVNSVRLLPVYSENYIPKPITGRLADVFLRRIGEFSHDYGALVYPYNNQGWVAFEASQVSFSDRTMELDVEIPESGITVVDLRMLAKSTESLLKAYSYNSDLTVRPGRDLLYFGDFEDWDVDDDVLETLRWNISGASREICAQTYRGRGALCTTRKSTNQSDSVTAFRNRTRIMGESTGEPNKDLTLFGYMYGENAGAVKIITRYYASSGNKTFGESETFIHPGGNLSWQAIMGDIHIPDDKADINDVENNPRAVRIFVRQSPPSTGEGKAIFDEFAIINWEENMAMGQEIVTPHARDFLRIEGQPGKHHLALTFRAYQPHGSFFVAPKLQANGQDFLRTDTNTKVALAVSLEHKSAHQDPLDWWLTVDTDAGVLSYVYPDGWRVGEHRVVSSPLINFKPITFFEGLLPSGRYPIEFCIDDNSDNKKDCTWKDSLNIFID